jgi:hypothetical protein
MATTTVEIDTGLLGRLRERQPGRSDRELVERAVSIQLGRGASTRTRRRFRGVSATEIEAEAVRAVREVRHEMAAERKATG